MSAIREIVFGMEDGMVSTFGAVIGIATGTQNQFTVILSGVVIIAVESISMAMGSYLSSKSKVAIDQRKLFEEKKEIETYPVEEKKELYDLYRQDGWPEDLAHAMAVTASKDKNLLLKEMAYRELQIFPESLENPVVNGLYMLGSYIVGGAIPLLPYLLLPIEKAIIVSVPSTLLGLFLLGGSTTRFTKRSFFVAGLEMVTLASLAGLSGYLIGKAAQMFF